MKVRPLHRLALAAITLAALTLGAGCATSGYKQADMTGAGIAEFRQEITRGKIAVDATMASLSGVAAAANIDPRSAFERFSKDLSALESTANKIRKRAQDMKDQKNMDALVAELNTVAATLTPARAPK